MVLRDLIDATFIEEIGVLLQMGSHSVQGELAAGVHELDLYLDAIAQKVGGAVVINPFHYRFIAMDEALRVLQPAFGHLGDEPVDALVAAPVRNDEVLDLPKCPVHGLHCGIEVLILAVEILDEVVDSHLVDQADPCGDGLLLSALDYFLCIHGYSPSWVATLSTMRLPKDFALFTKEPRASFSSSEMER